MDESLLDAARVGAGWALERIYRLLAPAVHGYLRVNGADDPEAATNEVFVRAFRRLAEFDGDGDRLRSWVFTIAHNLLIDQRRFRSRRHEETPTADVPDRSGSAAAEDAALDALGGERVRRLLALVSPDQRDVLMLRFVADMSIEDVAAATGRSVPGVKALQKRGIDALRRLLHEVENISGEAVSPPAETTLTGV